jgi:hypothetical protein
MKIAMRRKAKPRAGIEDEYRTSLREYVAGGGEPALGRAYELGRRALTEQKSLVEMASLHHQAVLSLVRGTESEKRREELLRSSGEFFAECLSPYEMAHRGFQDAVKALRQLNETLEEEIKRIAYAVHDEAGQLLVAVHLALAEVAPELPEPQQVQVARIKELLNQVEKHLRRYSHELRPTILDDLGWIPAIRFLAEGISKRAALPIHIDASVSDRDDTLSHRSRSSNQCRQTCKGGECLDSCVERKSPAVLFDPGRRGRFRLLPGSSESGPQGLGTYRDAGAGDFYRGNTSNRVPSGAGNRAFHSTSIGG